MRKYREVAISEEERKQIFRKEVLSIADIEKLFGFSYDSAAKLIRGIRSVSDRIKVSGVVHVQDYIEYFNLPKERYLER